MKRAWRGRMVLLLILTTAACATAPARRPAPAPVHAAAAQTRAEKLEDPQLVSKLERKLKKSKGEQVLVSKKLLRQLLEEHRFSETQLARLSAQLEALKKVDLNDGSHPSD